MSITLEDKMSLYGAPKGSIHSLKEDASPENLPYLDLLDKKNLRLDLPDAVLEFQNRPLLYIVDHSEATIRNADEIGRMKRILFFKGDGAYLVELQPGKLIVHSSFSPNQKADNLFDQTIFDEKNSPFQAIPTLGYAFHQRTPSKDDYIHENLYRLMNDVVSKITDLEAGINHDEALSLAGRALFLRFLLDRKIVNKDILNQECGPLASELDSFETPQNAARINQWMDQVFNGDLLPLPLSTKVKDPYLNYFQKIYSNKKSISGNLQAILQRAESTGNGFQLKFGWEMLDFAHIPVGLLSQIYERHLHEFEKSEAKKTSVYYTPQNIARYMVDESFPGISEAHTARVLDPSCGAGVFLILCFRKLIQERWIHDGKRPDRKILRHILNHQIVGLDINESALRLSALGLYLTALELDAKPSPLNELKFDTLKNHVLYNVKIPLEKGNPYSPGSLHNDLEEKIGRKLSGEFDLVIGNPPWTKYNGDEGKALEPYLNEQGKRIIDRRREDWSPETRKELKNYKNPGKAPDSAFLLKAMEWAKPDAVISLAIHGRLLFAPRTMSLRKLLFQSLQITGVLNGADMRQTDLWPNMDQPFLLLFAVNRLPDPASSFVLVSPYAEETLNNNGSFRVDAFDAEPILHKEVVEKEYIAKAFFRGGYPSLEIIEKIINKSHVTIRDYWNKNHLKHRRGYQTEGEQFSLVGDFSNLRTITKETEQPFYTDIHSLPFFNHTKLHRGNEREFYCAPLILIHKKVPVSRIASRAILVLDDVAYSNEFYGYSGNGHKDAHLLIRYLFLLVHSNIFLYRNIVTSGEYGFERDIIYKDDIDSFPFLPPEKLTEEQKENIWVLANKLAFEDSKPFDEIDSFINGLYGLSKSDKQVIEDTLAVNLPTAESRKRADSEVAQKEKGIFFSEVKRILLPFFKTSDQKTEITEEMIAGNATFRLFAIHLQGEASHKISTKDRSTIFQIADESGASQIILRGENCLKVALLNRYRYWTPTRARFLAMEILDKHLDCFSAMEVL